MMNWHMLEYRSLYSNGVSQITLEKIIGKQETESNVYTYNNIKPEKLVDVKDKTKTRHSLTYRIFQKGFARCKPVL